MTSTSHRGCFHPSTSAARARCRRDRAQFAKDHAHEIEYNRLSELVQARSTDTLCSTAWHALASGVENADDSLEQLSIEQYSEEWYSLTISGFWSIMNDTPGNDLRWTSNILDIDPDVLDEAPYTWLDD